MIITMMTNTKTYLCLYTHMNALTHTHTRHTYSAHVHKSIHTEHNVHKEGETEVH